MTLFKLKRYHVYGDILFRVCRRPSVVTKDSVVEIECIKDPRKRLTVNFSDLQEVKLSAKNELITGLALYDEPIVKNYDIDSLQLHEDCEVVNNIALGKIFKYCRDHKKEVK